MKNTTVATIEAHSTSLLLRRVFRSASDELRDYKSRSVPARLVTASPAEDAALKESYEEQVASNYIH